MERMRRGEPTSHRDRHREEDVAEKVVCGPDPERHLTATREYIDAGYDLNVHQVGADQEGFFRFHQEQVLPKVG